VGELPLAATERSSSLTEFQTALIRSVSERLLSAMVKVAFCITIEKRHRVFTTKQTLKKESVRSASRRDSDRDLISADHERTRREKSEPIFR
jgi:hypothetical protein